MNQDEKENKEFQKQLEEWFVQLNKHSKYNVRLYSLKEEYEYELKDVDTELLGNLTNCDITLYHIYKYNKDETDISKRYKIIKNDYEDTDAVRDKIVSFLNKNKNIRVGNHFRYNNKYHYYLISSYEENQKYYNICGENENMYDDCMYVLYYSVRYSPLDHDGYYILSGMTDGFDKEEFYKKYNIDIWKQPYLL